MVLHWNKQGPKGVDLDDGTQYFLIQRNVVVWGEVKFKGSDITAINNVILKQEGGRG
mgnify:CR=1 FL=1